MANRRLKIRMSYKHYLKSTHWKEFKTNKYNSNPRNYRCYVCGKKTMLELHHITYENIGKEKLEDCIYLCRNHHEWATFQDDGSFQKWLERIRSKKLRNKKKYQSHKKPTHRKLFRAKSRKRTKMKKYAGLFTWKAEEEKQLCQVQN